VHHEFLLQIYYVEVMDTMYSNLHNKLCMCLQIQRRWFVWYDENIFGRSNPHLSKESIGESSLDVVVKEWTNKGSKNSSDFNCQDFNIIEEQHLQHLAFMYNNHIKWCKKGFMESIQL